MRCDSLPCKSCVLLCSIRCSIRCSTSWRSPWWRKWSPARGAFERLPALDRRSQPRQSAAVVDELHEGREKRLAVNIGLELTGVTRVTRVAWAQADCPGSWPSSGRT